jgi:hypothetical protein
VSIFDSYEQELLAKHQAIKETDREADAVRWKAERQAEIDAGLRDAEGEWIGPDLVEDEEPEDEEEDDEEDDEEDET